jgi:hypothetical protein
MRSSISTALELATGQGLGHDAWTTRVLKGQQNMRPSSPVYADYYDVDVLFHNLIGWADNHDLDDEHIQVKGIILVRIATLARSADVAQIIFSKCHTTKDGLYITMGRLKPDRSATDFHELPLIERLDPPFAKICVVRWYEHYVVRTSAWRAAMNTSAVPKHKLNRKEAVERDRLFLGRDRCHFPIGKERVANLSKAFLEGCGIDVKRYKGHSLRGAAATGRIDAGESVDDVMHCGRWKSISVFKRFYERAQKRVQQSAGLMARLCGSVLP